MKKTTFQNCLVAMRPKSTLLDLPTAHNVTNHLHNEFVSWLGKLKANIKVISAIYCVKHWLTYIPLIPITLGSPWVNLNNGRLLDC
jgi:hypothetical protein